MKTMTKQNNVLFHIDPFIKSVVEEPDIFVTKSEVLEKEALRTTKLLFDLSMNIIKYFDF
jgi:hypothetical protein